MSPAESAKKSGGPYRKPRADVYTVLLVLSLIALLLAILCLWFEMDMYEWKFMGGPVVSAVHGVSAGAVCSEPRTGPLTPDSPRNAVRGRFIRS